MGEKRDSYSIGTSLVLHSDSGVPIVSFSPLGDEQEIYYVASISIAFKDNELSRYFYKLKYYYNKHLKYYMKF